MTKSATDVMQDVINSALVDAVVALKKASKGLPNAFLRDLNAIHGNTAFGDLPEAVQKAAAASVRDAFAKLRKEGYAIAEVKSIQLASPQPPDHSLKVGPGAAPSRRAVVDDRLRAADGAGVNRPASATMCHLGSSEVHGSWKSRCADARGK